MLLLPHKSACTSMKRAVRTALGLEKPTGGVHDLPHPLSYIAATDIPSDHTVIGVIRDPWDRLVSGWNWLVQVRNHEVPLQPVQEFVDWFLATPNTSMNVHVRPQAYDFIAHGEVLPSQWLHVDRLDDEWPALCHRYGWQVCEMPHENRRGRNPDQVADLERYREALDARLDLDYWLYERACRAGESW